MRDFLEAAFGHVALDWRDYVVTDDQLFRPAEVSLLRGDYAKAKAALGWEPRVRFEELVAAMVTEDLQGQRAS